MSSTARRRNGVLAGLALALAVPATASAAPPVVTTGGTASITQSTATLKGRVNPKGNATQTFFQLGTSRLYGSETAPVDRGQGNKAIAVADAVGALSPFTTYHYRLAARFNGRLRFGEDRTFKSKRQPLGLTLGATPGTVDPGGETTITGNVSGTNNGGRPVVLQSDPYPFDGFQNVDNPQIVDAAGNFIFRGIPATINTQFRVQLPDKPQVVSPVITVSVKPKITTKLRARLKKGKKAAIYGKFSPLNPGLPVKIQRRVHGRFRVVAHATLDDKSRYSRKLRFRHSGRYRVRVVATPAYLQATGPTQRLKILR